jgi:hypothetical protein
MASDVKERIQNIIEAQCEKDAKPKLVSKKKQFPERKVQHEIHKWAKVRGWSLDVVDASSAWNSATESYSKTFVQSGFPDSVGCMPTGRAVYIEFKAPGKRNNLKPHQREFLVNKINLNAFACCSDSVDHLSKLYASWLHLGKEFGPQNSKQLLLDDLPIKKENSLEWD